MRTNCKKASALTFTVSNLKKKLVNFKKCRATTFEAWIIFDPIQCLSSVIDKELCFVDNACAPNFGLRGNKLVQLTDGMFFQKVIEVLSSNIILFKTSVVEFGLLQLETVSIHISYYADASLADNYNLLKGTVAPASKKTGLLPFLSPLSKMF